MSDQATSTAVAPKKRRAPQGPRRPSPIYAFVKAGDAGQVQLTAQFRDPRKMATYVAQANANGEQLLVIAPEE